ncbi:hypothetical protein VA596_50085 [Amycolatopsis sp., V23-08]|uniref:Uncharacterized protein n=1 Tax=Amycolatopsis heterodermiae TaxID=3110235 RepID=A0ABU5RN65_9PSEU|nr:hypothetical protein [Amycolatopsis sp., V23-08]MEA5367762.1 hypothetical protein [Amycolatopsis sp., V23-08]
MTNRQWTFRTEVVRPDGVTVSAAVSLPEGQAGKRFLDISELGQMAAAQLVTRLNDPRYVGDGELFQPEVPF